MPDMPDLVDLRAQARNAFLAGVAAADPFSAVETALRQRPVSPDFGGKLFVISVGKAAVRMADAAKASFPATLDPDILIVTNSENAVEVPGTETIAAGHPVPDSNSLKAGNAVWDLLRQAGQGDLVLALVSGGASALVVRPVDGVGLEDKIAVNELLLRSGLDIYAMNLVRQSLSTLKGGGMRRWAAPAEMRSFIISDVLGDDLRVIASGPTVGPVGSVFAAAALLKREGLFQQLPTSVQIALQRKEESPLVADPDAVLVGSNRQSLETMAEHAGARISAGDLAGDVQAAAERVVREAMELPPGNALAFGGETTVRVTGNGKGGRNQELALRVALEADRQGLAGPWCFLSGGTDGRDGPTDAAGGIVDATSLDRLKAAGIDLADTLSRNDSYPALRSSGDLLDIGATGTNVADLQIFIRGGT